MHLVHFWKRGYKNKNTFGLFERQLRIWNSRAILFIKTYVVLTVVTDLCTNWEKWKCFKICQNLKFLVMSIINMFVLKTLYTWNVCQSWSHIVIVTHKSGVTMIIWLCSHNIELWYLDLFLKFLCCMGVALHGLKCSFRHAYLKWRTD